MRFKYRNWQNETEERVVQPLVWGWLQNPGWGYEPGWFLHALDLEKQQTRTFSMLPDRMMPSDLMEMDDGGQIEMFKFPSEIELKFYADLSQVREAVLGLEKAVQELPAGGYADAIAKETIYFYRHKGEGCGPVKGPVYELPYAVKTNRDAFDVWEGHA